MERKKRRSYPPCAPYNRYNCKSRTVVLVEEELLSRRLLAHRMAEYDDPGEEEIRVGVECAHIHWRFCLAGHAGVHLAVPFFPLPSSL